MDTMTNTTLLWIIIAAVVVVLVLVGIIVAGNRRKQSKTVSFDAPEEPKELTQQDRSGNYQAKGGFNFAPVEAQPDLVPRESSRRASAETPGETPGGGSTAVPSHGYEAETGPGRVPRVPAEPVAEPPAEPADETAGGTRGAVAPDDPEFEKPVDHSGSSPAGTPAGTGHVDEPAYVIGDGEPAADNPERVSGDVDKQGGDDLGELIEQHEAVEEEAEEAAEAAAVTAEAVEEARSGDAIVSEDAIVTEPAAAEPIDDIEPAAGRIGKLRGRLSRSQNAIGQGLLGILTAGDLDEDAWEEIEDTLIMADLGASLTLRITDSLREKIAERGVSSEAEARAMLRETLVEAGRPGMDRSLKAMPNEGKPAVILVVGVNGTGKTTTTGKLARVLVSMGHSVVLGAADTFRAAAADQLETWGRRVGATTVRGKEGADPAAVAFDAVATGVDQGADVVLVDTAGRLHTATGLMDQLGKVKRVVEKKTRVDEVLLVLDATVGQNGITQARVFRDVVDITGVVLTKLDGTAKGGIVFQVQEELGVPVKLVGLGEGADDLAPFEVESFVDALLG
ncbi:signal recognition particle-docking protein FtsY [Corynebacterium sp. UBA2622]|uniref:signal recognition particle-docking protein FtsY n=1 Tax=Corynebacterium sp. UBA2622 TaxID=1946393 RepID=UPI0025C60B95|nr:signal recognition particle-docking protein FtsY [Corynebacterium sp. UBA2622]